MLQMGDQSVEMTEEKQDEAQIAKGKAVEAMADGKLLLASGFCSRGTNLAFYHKWCNCLDL